MRVSAEVTPSEIFNDFSQVPAAARAGTADNNRVVTINRRRMEGKGVVFLKITILQMTGWPDRLG